MVEAQRGGGLAGFLGVSGSFGELPDRVEGEGETGLAGGDGGGTEQGVAAVGYGAGVGVGLAGGFVADRG